MNIMNIVPLVVIAITVLVSYKGFNDEYFFNRFKFNISAILRTKQKDRLITSGFLHADIAHLLFNMITLYFFSGSLIAIFYNFNASILFSIILYLITYLGSIVIGNLLTLWVYQKDHYYSAIGASGGVNGVIFAVIAIFPKIQLSIMFIPIPIEGWIFAIVYLGYSVYGMKSQLGNIGHTAHLGGAIFGMFISLLLFPEYIYINRVYLLFMLIPIIILAVMVYYKK